MVRPVHNCWSCVYGSDVLLSFTVQAMFSTVSSPSRTRIRLVIHKECTTWGLRNTTHEYRQLPLASGVRSRRADRSRRRHSRSCGRWQAASPGACGECRVVADFRGSQAQQRNTRFRTGSTTQHSRRLGHRMSCCCAPRAPIVVLLRIRGDPTLNSATFEDRTAQQRNTGFAES